MDTSTLIRRATSDDCDYLTSKEAEFIGDQLLNGVKYEPSYYSYGDKHKTTNIGIESLQAIIKYFQPKEQIYYQSGLINQFFPNYQIKFVILLNGEATYSFKFSLINTDNNICSDVNKKFQKIGYYFNEVSDSYLFLQNNDERVFCYELTNSLDLRSFIFLLERKEAVTLNKEQLKKIIANRNYDNNIVILPQEYETEVRISDTLVPTIYLEDEEREGKKAQLNVNLVMEYSYIEQNLKDKVTHLKDESKYIIIKRNEVKKNNRRKNKEYLPKTQISTTE